MTSEQQTSPDDLLTVDDVIAMLRIDRRQLRILVQGGFPGFKLPGVRGLRFARADVVDWVERRRRRVA